MREFARRNNIPIKERKEVSMKLHAQALNRE